MATLREEMEKIWKILHKHEGRLRTMNLEKVFKQFFRRKIRWERQKEAYQGLHLAICVDTRDPYKQHRVRFFSPVLDSLGTGDNTDNLRQTKLNQLLWAWPISNMGGFDDCGLSWVPPPGTTLCIMFQNGSPNSPYYLGTTWQRDKGPENAHNWHYDIPEYDKIFRGHRKGYMVGKNDGSQAFPAWNTDQYQGYDFDSQYDSELNTDAGLKTTWPHLYGFSSPEKHRVKMDDGDPKCNRRWKRLEIISSMGHYFLMKDDPYHHCGEWVNPNCRISHTYAEPSVCNDPVFQGVVSGISVWGEYPCQQGPEQCDLAQEQYIPPETQQGPVFNLSTIPVESEYLGTEHLCPGFDPFATVANTVPDECSGVLRPDHYCFTFNNTGKNRYHKHRQECYPFLSDKCALQQSGMQLLSRAGHTLVFDDSVEEPRERPEWERTLNPFDMDGCTGVYKGRTFWRSSTGHFIELNDHEVSPKVRGPNNGINIVTACGNQIILNDHSTPNCVAGPNRGVHIKSTSNHSLDFVDDQNQQCSPERNGCANPGPWSNKAFIRMRSGYGITMTMNDAQSQTKTDQQYFQIMSPQTDNLQRGPHVLHMQERASGSGQIFLRAGGDYIIYTYDHMVEVVGDEKDNPSNKLEFISNMKVVSVKDVYYNKAKTHCFWAEDYIFLLAGKDCAVGEGADGNGTCVYPVVVATGPIPEFIMQMCNIKASEHVFASATTEFPQCESDNNE